MTIKQSQNENSRPDKRTLEQLTEELKASNERARRALDSAIETADKTHKTIRQPKKGHKVE